MDRQQEFVLRTIEERDIRFVRLWFTDVLGFLKSVAIAPAELDGAFSEGIGFDGSSIEGFSRVSEADTVAKPDPSTFQVLPWTDDRDRHYSCRMFCDIAMPDGTPSWADSRHVLRRQLNKAADLGFSCYVHPEIEFFLLKNLPTDGSEPIPADNGGYFDQAVHDVAPTFRRDAIGALESMGISVEFSHHEAAPGQQEIDLRYADALSMADNVMTFRYLIKEVAMNAGVHATFMPKPFTHHAGSAMHTHMSLFEGDTNAFHDPDDELQLSATGKAFIAGILHHAPEISAVTNQWVNSYKRLVAGDEAPTAATWGAANRSAMVRVPLYTPNKASSRRIEVRSPDSACNPYLAFAVLAAAGLAGIAGGYDLPEAAEENVWRMTARERRSLGYRDLPASLDDALVLMEKSELVAEALGEHVFEYFLRNKWSEWNDYRSVVTPFELKRFLTV
ncbi:type I glutamate--ammonia ligase [Tsukamurella soli]|uniref:Type I glutamate--ammonia ligase n=1 Tax=Tsukamurella soli TaxID=644556 RepID=A0ABP8JRB8_9ACTN